VGVFRLVGVGCWPSEGLPRGLAPGLPLPPGHQNAPPLHAARFDSRVARSKPKSWRAKLALVRLSLFVPYNSDATDSLGVGLVEKGHLLG